MTKPLYFWNGTTFELVGPTTPQSPFAYQTSAPTAPATGDIWIDSDGDVDTYNRQLTRYYFVATAGQTSVSGVDANGLTLAYVAGSEAVYVNGALQVRGVDYTATNGTSITGLSALALNDVVEVFAYTAFTVANAYTKTETDSVAAAAAGLRMIVPSSVAVGSGTASANAAGFVTFSSATSVSLNDVFSTNYLSYLILIDYSSTSNGDTLRGRLRVSGSDANTNYNEQNNSIDGTTISGARNSNQTAWGLCINGSGSRNLANLVLSSPFETRTTTGFSTGVSSYVTIYQRNYYLNNTNATSYTGFTIYPDSGTISGTIAVYGYKD